MKENLIKMYKGPEFKIQNQKKLLAKPKFKFKKKIRVCESGCGQQHKTCLD